MPYVHCVWTPLKIQFRDSVECRLRKSRWVTSSTDLWITSKCFIYCVRFIYRPSGWSSSRLFSISVLAGPMCRILRKIPQNRPGTSRLSVWKSFCKTLNYPLSTSSRILLWHHKRALLGCELHPNHVVLKFGSSERL